MCQSMGDTVRGDPHVPMRQPMGAPMTHPCPDDLARLMVAEMLRQLGAKGINRGSEVCIFTNVDYDRDHRLLPARRRHTDVVRSSWH